MTLQSRLHEIQFFVYDWMIQETDPFAAAPSHDDEDSPDEEESGRSTPPMPKDLTLMGYTIPTIPEDLRSHAPTLENGVARLCVQGYRPYFYVSLPSWVSKPYLIRHGTLIIRRIVEMMRYHDAADCPRASSSYARERCPRCWDTRPAMGKNQFVERGRLYYGQTRRSHGTADAQGVARWWYLRLRFTTQAERRRGRYLIDKKPVRLPSWRVGNTELGTDRWMCRVYEAEASPILQMTSNHRLPTVGWVRLREGARTAIGVRSSPNWEVRCHIDDILVCQVREDVPRPTILSFDIEVYSADKNRMPSAENATDEIFEIGVSAQSRTTGIVSRYLLQSCPKQQQEAFRAAWDGSKGRLVLCSGEKELLLRFRDLWQHCNPQIVTGYNIFGFDFPYILDRCRRHGIEDTFLHLGPFHEKASIREVAWSSAAYRDQHFVFPETQGVLSVDLLPLVRRDFKLSNYKLKTVSSFFIGDTKDPLTPQDLFRAFEQLWRQDNAGCEGMLEAAVYCIQDADLVLRLFHHLQTWIGLCEMARISQVSLWSLYTQGQQIKVFSQIYRLCQEKQFVIDPPAEPDVLPYTGATVFPPKPGIYSWVVPFDFASLYPTTIIAYNIDYSTYIEEASLAHHLPSTYHTIEWEEHTACAHDPEVYTPATRPTYVFCGARRYHFLKEPKGVLPELLESLLDARKQTRRQLAGLPKDDAMREVLDKRQLAYKISANSMYGAMGVVRGYLPFMPGAMCTTAMGRQNIEKAAAHVQSVYGAELIYGDTDSIYVHFPTIDQAQTLWDHACRIEKELLSLFPRPMKLAFEEKLYKKFLILTKKRYMALACDEKDRLDAKLTIRGVMLARRDNCVWARRFYERTVRSLMASSGMTEMINEIADGIQDLFTLRIPLANLIITKLVGSGYTLPPLPSDPKKRTKRLTDLGLQHRETETIPTECACGTRGCQAVKRPPLTASSDKTNVDPVGLGWMMAIEALFRHCFTQRTPTLRFSNQTRLASSEYLTLIRTGTLLEWRAQTDRQFYTPNPVSDPTQSDELLGSSHQNMGVIDWILRRARTSPPPEAGAFPPKQTLEQRGWNPVMLQIGRETLRRLIDLPTAHEIKLTAPLTIEQLQKYVEKEVWNADARRRRHCDRCDCFGCAVDQRSLPAHAQLARRMHRRGTIVEAGTRLEYVVVRHPNDPKAKLFEKLEDPAHCRRFGSLYRIDPFYYLHLLSFPMDQLLEVCFHKPKLFSREVEYHQKKWQCIQEMVARTSPEFHVLEAVCPYQETLRFALPIPSRMRLRNGRKTL